MSSQFVFEVNQTNINALLEQSRTTPVLIDFWADWCQPCQQIAPILEKLAAEWQGRLIIAKLDVEQEQALAAQFGVRSLPTLKLVFQGQLVGEQTGALSEVQLRQWLEPLLSEMAGGADDGAEVEAFLTQIREAVAAGQADAALVALQDFVSQFPEQLAARLLLVELLLDQGELEQAQTLLADIEDPQAQALQSRLALLQAAGSEPVENLDSLPPEQKIAAARQVAAQGQWENGLEALLSVLREHRDEYGESARSAMLELFEAMPKGDPLTSLYRRKLFNLLH